LQKQQLCVFASMAESSSLAAWHAHLLALLLHRGTHALQAGRIVELRMLEAALAATSIPITLPHTLPDIAPHVEKHVSRPATFNGLRAVMQRDVQL